MTEPWWRDTPAEVGLAFLRWNEAIDELQDVVAEWPTDPVERARIFDGLDLGDIAARIDAAINAVRLLPGMKLTDELDQKGGESLEGY